MLHDYALWAGGIGPYMLDAFVHFNPHNFGFLIVCQQMMEHWGKWMKGNRRQCGNPRGNKFLFEIADNFDLYGMGRILYDLIDFKHVANEQRNANVHSFDNYANEQVENNLLNDVKTPHIFKQLVHILNRIQVNDDVPQSVETISKQSTLDADVLVSNLKKHLNNVKIQNEMKKQVKENASNNQSQPPQPNIDDAIFNFLN